MSPLKTDHSTLYETDYLQWLETTVESVRHQDYTNVDWSNLIAEMEDMGRNERRSLENNLIVILLHLLKWQYQLFLYQEQALSPNFSQPYRQRFLRISPSADSQSVESLSFRPLQLEDWVGLCDRPQTERVVQISDMDRSSCSVLLQRVGATYMGETQPGGCPSNYRGAVRVTNHIILHPTGMETSDRGFDANGNQVWGSTGEPYRFQRRVVPSNSGV